MKRGVQELTGPRQLGDYLLKTDDGRHTVLRGKYKGAFIDEIPGGYIRHYILLKWADSMNPAEQQLFEQYGKKEEPMPDENQTKPEAPPESRDIIKEAFDLAAKTGHATISIKNTLKTAETEVEAIRTEATDEELKESEELVEKLADSIIEPDKKPVDTPE